MAGIFDAAKSGDAQLAATLLEGNKGLTAGYDENGWTALHQAASRGNEKMFNAVVSAGGDLNRKTKDGRTPLEVAQSQAFIRAVRKVLR